MPGPLEGVKIVELAHWVAVPAAMAILSDWGASVVKIEDPRTGDAARGLAGMGIYPFPLPTSTVFEMDNRNKRSIALDLRSDKGRAVVYRLAEDADVFATNFEPAVLKRFGLEYDDLAQVNRRLVYLSLSGYGERGPERERPGYDYSAYWARSGIMATLGEPDAPPVGPRPGIGDHATSMMITGAVTAALLYREKTGLGQKVSTALVHCGMWQLGADITTTAITGQEIPRTSRRAPGNVLAGYYETGDGQWIQLAMPQADRYWPTFCRAIGRLDLERDPRFSSLAARRENAAVLVAILDGIFLTKTRAAWGTLLDSHGCVWGKIQATVEVVADEQLWENGFLTKVEHASLGEITLIAAPGTFSRTPGAVRSAAPETGQHTEEVLLEAGYSWDDLADLKEGGAIL